MLEPSEAEDDIVKCSLAYENGTVTSLVVMCIAKRGWIKNKPLLVVSIVELDSSMRVVRIYSSEAIGVPTGPDDLPFALRFSALVRAMAWTVTATSTLGECVSLPGRSPA
jgi:hypothetical protein